MNFRQDRDTSFEDDRDAAPLLSNDASGQDASNADRDEQPELSIPKLLALTCINGGLQVFFSTVMANLSPYLQNLGLSKSVTAAIVISLPLSGAIIGPIAGASSDRLRTRFGRRRPFILGGAILTTSFLLLLSWTPQLVKALAGCLESNDCSAGVQTGTIALAVICTILLSISVQPVQACVRGLMVDIAPASQQSQAASYGGRIQGACSIFAFFASSQNLPDLPGLHRLTQFQALACLNLITLGSTVLLTCIFIKEKDTRKVELGEQESTSPFIVLKHIFQTVKELRGRIRTTCLTQFCSWFAWFPLTYYTTTYIGEIGMADVSIHYVEGKDHGAQDGSLASLNFAIVGFVAILTLPVILPYVGKLFKGNRATLDDTTEDGQNGLIWLWVGTQPLLGVILVATLATAYRWQGIVLIAAAGVPWAVTQWVPFAVVGYEISKLGLTGTRDQDERSDSKSGAIMGVHNLAISLPQVLSGLLSSLTYMIAEKAGSEIPTAWVLASSGIAAFLASALARRML